MLGEATDMLEFLFKSDDEIVIDEKALKGMPANLVEVVEATVEALEGVSEWNAEAIQVALRAKLVDELELKPRQAFGPADEQFPASAYRLRSSSPWKFLDVNRA